MIISWKSRMAMIMKRYTMFFSNLSIYHGVYRSFLRRASPANWFKAFSELINEEKLPSDCQIKIIGNLLKLDVPEDIIPNVLQIESVAHSEAIQMSLDVDTLVVIHSTGRKRSVYGQTVRLSRYQ